MIYLLPHIIKNGAKQRPEKIAFKCGNDTLTYLELWTKSKQLANFLTSIGIKKGDRIGIYINRSIDTPVAIFGALQAGAAYVPLDPKNPHERNQFIINDCQIKTVISNQALSRNLNGIVTSEIQLKSIIGLELNHPQITSISWEKIYQFDHKEQTNNHLLGEDLAYILYTSGSTGEPKGIMHSHSSGLGYGLLSVDFFNITDQDILANHASVNFDISTLGYFAGPAALATTVIIPEPYIKMPSSLAKLIASEKITIWYSVPSALQQLIDQDALKEENYSSLRWVLFAGEPFPTSQLKQLMTIWSHPKFCNIFGPTEVNGCTYFILDDIPESDAPISIGISWGNTDILVVDDNNQPADKGQPGELLVRSITRMIGYWGQPIKTEKSLFKRINNARTEEVYYRTGDIVQEDENGNLKFLGRRDRQVKVSGYRIELDEISTVISKLDKIEEVATFVTSDQKTDKKIVAAIVQLGDTYTDEDVAKHCNKHLPHYAIPSSIVFLAELPRTDRGKVDFQFLMHKSKPLLK